MDRLDNDIENCRRQNMHTRHCNSLAPQPKQEGFQYDYYVIMHCDCLLSVENPTEAEKIAFLRKIAEVYPWPHDKKCPQKWPKYELYRGKMVSVRMNCTCWLSELDKPKPEAYTEPMTSEFLILPIDRSPAFFDTDRTYPNERAAINMLAYQGYSTDPNSPGYWGHDNRIVTKEQWEDEKHQAQNPVVNAIKAQIDQIRAQSLGPHLDTPIYDALAREYDKKYSNLSYFETDLGRRITHLSQFVAKHTA